MKTPFFLFKLVHLAQLCLLNIKAQFQVQFLKFLWHQREPDNYMNCNSLEGAHTNVLYTTDSICDPKGLQDMI